MPGLFLALSRARTTSRALLCVFVAVLTLTSFGHQCSAERSASWEPSASAASPVWEAAAAHDTPAHSCPACVWEKQSLAALPAHPHVVAPGARPLFSRRLLAAAPARGLRLACPSRGPPSA